MKLTVNGEIREIDADPDMPLLWALRDRLGVKGPKYGCGIGACGACTVWVDGVPTRSCSLPLGAVEGEVTTIEGLPAAFAAALVAKAAKAEAAATAAAPVEIAPTESEDLPDPGAPQPEMPAETAPAPASSPAPILTTPAAAPAPNALTAVQQAWEEEQVPQCGYCQAGQIMAASALLLETPAPDDSAIDAAMTNLCRCGTYPRIRRAIHRAADILAEG